MTRSWTVGGALRDELLGREVTDIDIAVEGDPEAAARERARAGHGPVLRRCEGVGAGRVVDRDGGRVYDFAPLQGGTIEEDLARRDFTINAMARPREGGDLIDPLGGKADVESRTLRVVGPEAYESDPLRALRLARFAAELGFSVDPDTERLTAKAAARVREASGELREVLDEPLADELTRGQALRFGALLHDIGKPATHDVREDGRVTFLGHDRLGEEMVRQVSRRLRASDRLSRFLQAVTRLHLVLGFLVRVRPLDRRAFYR